MVLLVVDTQTALTNGNYIISRFAASQYDKERKKQ
jgi:hypothetical protein